MSIPIATDIKIIRENYDTTNPMVAEIIKAKEERLIILQELNKQQENEFAIDFKLSEASRKSLKDDESVKKEKVAKKRKTEKSFPQISIRRSTRLLNSPTVTYTEEHIDTDYVRSEKSEIRKPPIERPPNDYGPVPGVDVGFHWETRMECSMYGVHRPTVAGIHGGPAGAYSIALSGGYPEDIDEGYSFIYTGAGGRDLKGTSTKPKNLRIAPQTKDQQLEGTNLSLVKSIKSKLPIRVIRGYKSPSIYAPATGYRYDGLYQVVEYWEDVGKSGHRIYRFRMERVKDQEPPPWEATGKPRRLKQRKPAEDESEDEDCKENVRPTGDGYSDSDSEGNSESGISYSDDIPKNVTTEDVKHVDAEIEKCIDFFCKAAVIEVNWNESSVGKSSDEDADFPGWDEQVEQVDEVTHVGDSDKVEEQVA